MDKYRDNIILDYSNIISSYLDFIANKFNINYNSITIDSINDITDNTIEDTNNKYIYEVTLNINSKISQIIKYKQIIKILENKLLQIFSNISDNSNYYYIDNIEISIIDNNTMNIYYNLIIYNDNINLTYLPEEIIHKEISKYLTDTDYLNLSQTTKILLNETYKRDILSYIIILISCPCPAL